jgi:hypothetical protein
LFQHALMDNEECSISRKNGSSQRLARYFFSIFGHT